MSRELHHPLPVFRISRRRALFMLLSGLSLFAVQPAPRPGVADEPAVVLTHGPMLGAPTDTTIKIWARSSGSGRLCVEVKPIDQFWPGRVFGATRLDLTADFTGFVTVNGLMPEFTYEYRLILNGIGLGGGSFRTLPAAGQPGTFRFALGGDLDERFAPFTILDRVREQQPAFEILLGDLVYADSPTAIPPTVEAYRTKYRTNWSDGAFRRLTARVPSFVMWDDHEIVNDYDGGDEVRYQAARMALEEYGAWANPPSRRDGALYYAFQVADVSFFVLDTRSYRDRNARPDGDGKTMLGAQQKTDLQQWLIESRAPFKFVLSSVPFHDLGPLRPDDWNAFATERDELLAFIRQQRISGVVILSGDQHWCSIVHFAEYGIWEINTTPLAQHVRPQDRIADPRLVLTYQASTAFGIVDVDTQGKTPQLTVSVMDNMGQVQGTHTITVETPAPPR